MSETGIFEKPPNLLSLKTSCLLLSELGSVFDTSKQDRKGFLTAKIFCATSQETLKRQNLLLFVGTTQLEIFPFNLVLAKEEYMFVFPF